MDEKETTKKEKLRVLAIGTGASKLFEQIVPVDPEKYETVFDTAASYPSPAQRKITYDVVVANFIFGLVEWHKAEKKLSAIFERVRPGGTMVIIEPAFDQVYRAEMNWADLNTAVMRPGTASVYRLNDLRTICEIMGFFVKEARIGTYVAEQKQEYDMSIILAVNARKPQ